jgi:hypothetical protein
VRGVPARLRSSCETAMSVKKPESWQIIRPVDHDTLCQCGHPGRLHGVPGCLHFENRRNAFGGYTDYCPCYLFQPGRVRLRGVP